MIKDFLTSMFIGIIIFSVIGILLCSIFLMIAFVPYVLFGIFCFTWIYFIGSLFKPLVKENLQKRGSKFDKYF